MNLVAVLIVRDEAANLPACLASLGGLVDGVHVHDTGSADDSAGIARSLGATVSSGPWRDDFAAARNDALQAAGRPDWVLSVDADERACGVPRWLHETVSSAAADAFLVELDNRHDELPYTHRSPRLFRPAALHWEGRVHERLAPPGAWPELPRDALHWEGRVHERLAPPGAWPELPRDALHLAHHGYERADARRRKAERNAALAEEALRRGVAGRDELATTLLDLGRSYVGAERRQAAVDAFERLREVAPPGARQWILGTDALARLLLGAGHDEAVVVLARQLRAEGVEPQYCDWLEAQALAQLGRAGDAWRLLEGVHEVVDPAGRRYAPEHLAALKGLLAELVSVR
ncbi:glycosyltransferase [Dactylosporangium sp. CA-139066]|uniref:glycosyltransferase n=1 Tax=Dactylosporangium sp. CA-139066 TaxID=3239930 RepID=UPI003D8F2B2F